jgi:hypothetical protein
MEQKYLETRIRKAIRHGAFLECGSDGGLSQGEGTMGYAVTDGTAILCKGSGPADGDPDTMSSRRSELFGLAALMELLLLISRNLHFLARAGEKSVKVRVWVDSSSAIKQFQRILQRRSPRPMYPDDADILAHLAWMIPQLSIYDIHIEWVKAHQDSGAPMRDRLPLNAQINVLVDELATRYREETTSTQRKPRKQALMFHAAEVSLLVNGRRVTAQYKETLRYHINGTRLRRFLQSTRNWYHGLP